MNAPRVVAVMLVDGRAAMVSRAIRSFLDQTWGNKQLLVYDTTPESEAMLGVSDERITVWFGPAANRSIGELRNAANAIAVTMGVDIIAHFDSDDFSHAERLTEQVAHLKASGAHAVGYYDMIFWKSPQPIQDLDAIIGRGCDTGFTRPGEAWLFSSPNRKYCLGTSLLYPRATWDRIPFPHKSVGEDTEFCLRVKTSAVSSLGKEPRMIASIHGTNTSSKIIPGAREWLRLPRMDSAIGRIMAL